MKKKLMCVLLSMAVVVVFSVPCFASADCNIAAQCDEYVTNEVSDIIEDMQDASEDGTISVKEQKAITKEYSDEAINEYSELAYQEMEEVLDGYQLVIESESGEPVIKQDVINLDCGAQVEIEVSSSPIVQEENDQEVDYTDSFIASMIGNFLDLGVYAKEKSSVGSIGFGENTFTTKAKLIELGVISITMKHTIKASKNGLEITKVKKDCNDAGLMRYINDEDHFKITSRDSFAKTVGSTCHTTAKIRFYDYVIGNWKLFNRDFYFKSNWKVTSISTKSKKVGYTLTLTTWTKKI